MILKEKEEFLNKIGVFFPSGKRFAIAMVLSVKEKKVTLRFFGKKHSAKTVSFCIASFDEKIQTFFLSPYSSQKSETSVEYKFCLLTDVVLSLLSKMKKLSDLSFLLKMMKR